MTNLLDKCRRAINDNLKAMIVIVFIRTSGLFHIRNMKKMLTTEKEGIGRKLDFMAQEMNREANTILSKSSDLEISNIAIDLKTEIEKVREQIQNVE